MNTDTVILRGSLTLAPQDDVPQLPTRTNHVASIHKDIPIDAPRDDVRDAVRDFGAVHTRLAPGFAADCRLDGNARIVTFHTGGPILTFAYPLGGHLCEC